MKVIILLLPKTFNKLLDALVLKYQETMNQRKVILDSWLTLALLDRDQ